MDPGKSCTDLAAGLYHYDPVGHRLGRLSGVTPDLTLVLSHAAMAAGMDPGQLQVLLVYTARFQRVAWKYSSLAYALILKDVGVLMQNMYLAAAAMGLAPCALGVGDSDRFARAIDSDYCDESSVGEFLLGSTA
ncbi:MAG: SagB family peptide dehydrogenase [Candidatus Riflebacteria bacterium]|nr:SagB family peptide dehydrogenase [Candidatus Riflebacteria bacterium]